jgi:hypothetical protein
MGGSFVSNKNKEQPLYIDICNDFMRSREYTAQDKFVYMILKSMSFSNNRSYNGIAPFSVEVILSMIGFVINTKNKNSIKESVDKLINTEMIEVYEDFLGRVKVDSVKLSNVYFVRVTDNESCTYTRIYQSEAYKLMTMDNKNKAKLFTVFMEIVSYIYVNETSVRYAFPNIETIENNTGVNRKTIMKYIQQLKDEQVLYFESYKKGSKEKHVYSRWNEQKYVKRYVQEQMSEDIS